MSYYEYKVVPAPTDAPRLKGVKDVPGRYAQGLAAVLNEYGAAGWEFQRTETLGATAKAGLLSRVKTETVTMMIFRRWVETAELADEPLPDEEPYDYEAPAEPRLTGPRPFGGQPYRIRGSNR